MIDPRILEIANRELTVAQLEVLGYVLDGWSQRRIAYHLDLSRTTVTDRIDAAFRTLRRHGIMVTPDGRPYLAEQELA